MELSLTPTTFMFCLVVIFQQIQLHETMPRNKPRNDELVASHFRPILLYSKQGHYVAILADGTVTATADSKSPDAVLEMHSYSVNKKRIRRPNSDLWLSIDKRGTIRTRTKKRKDTIFYEHDDGLWLWYENKHGVLAFRKNFQPKHNVTRGDLEKKEKNKFSKFLIMKLGANIKR